MDDIPLNLIPQSIQNLYQDNIQYLNDVKNTVIEKTNTLVEEKQTNDDIRYFMEYLQNLETFSNEISIKQNDWTNRLHNIIETYTPKIKQLNDEIKESILENGHQSTKKEEQIIYFIRKVCIAFDKILKLNRDAFKKFFMKKYRKQEKHINEFILHHNDNQDNEDIKYITNKYKELHNKISDINNKFVNFIEELRTFISGSYDVLSGKNKEEIEEYINDTLAHVEQHGGEIEKLYELKYSLLEMIIDIDFYVLYFIKVIRLLFVYISLFLATRLFVPIYEDTVYDDKKDPPPLWKYLLIFIGFDVTLNIFLLVFMYLLSYLFKTDSNDFFIDEDIIIHYLFDYGCTTALIVFTAFLISRVIVQKKYFKYKYEGMRAIRAFEKIVFNIALTNLLIPFFVIV